MKAEQLLTHKEPEIREIAKFLEKKTYFSLYFLEMNGFHKKNYLSFYQRDRYNQQRKISFEKELAILSWSNPCWRWQLAIYDPDSENDCTKYVDKQIGRLLAFLDTHHFFN